MSKKKVMAVGHLCVDMHPKMTGKVDFNSVISPGKIVNVAEPTFCSGGVVGNTGIGLFRLEQNVSVVGIVGDDFFGKVTLDILRNVSEKLTNEIIVKPGETTSYSIVLEAEGYDRCILHCPGANNTFSVTDIDFSKLTDVDLFHFGYPPIMREFYLENGANLRKMFANAQEKGAVTSLDMSLPDPESEGGKIDWIALLENVLPHVDIFLPSIDEICYMLKIDLPKSLETLQKIAFRLINMGVGVVGIKMGTDGIFVQSSNEITRISACNQLLTDTQAWTGKSLHAPCRKTNVISTKGAGDSTIAGFLAGILEGFTPEKAIECAVTVGACCVENEDATKGITSWQQITERMNKQEERLPVSLADC